MKSILAAAAAILMLGSAAMAQQAVGGGTSPARNRGAETPTLAPPVHMSGEVLQIDLERNAIQIRMKRNNRMVDAGFALDAQCRIKADKKQFGKGQLELGELKAGYLVEMTVRPSDMLVIEMKVKLPREATPLKP